MVITPAIQDNNMLWALFTEKRNIAMEKRILIDRKVELIKDKMLDGHDKKDLQIQKSIEQVQRERTKQDQLNDDIKRKEHKAK